MGFKARATAGDDSGGMGAFAPFGPIYARAVARKGSPEALAALLPAPRSLRALVATPDDRYLSAMSKTVFRAGFVWKVVENKWPGFEEAFGGFQVLALAGMDDTDLEELASDARIIRNRTKIAAVRDNARFILDVSDQWGGFGRYLAQWPQADLIGLWADLHARGSRLGGASRTVLLRDVGKDTFMLSGDVVRALCAAGIVDKSPSSQRDLRRTQAAFNAWSEETGRPFCELSRILACSVD